MTEVIAETKRDRAALLELLKLARIRASSEEKPFLVSISLEVNFLDPLAVLESIWERSEWHAYFENVAEDTAFAAAEAVEKSEFYGSSRCHDAALWLNDLLGRCIEAGDTQLDGAGPQALIGMTFADEVADSSPFAPLTVWIPRWQIRRTNDQTIAVANALIESDSDIEAIAERMLRAHGRFAEFVYRENAQSKLKKAVLCAQPPDKLSFTSGVRRAVDDIKAGAFRKIVLARSETLQADSPLDPIQPLSNMRERFWGCHCFAFGNDQGTSFIGATPEILFSLKRNVINTHALAGSISRGNNAREDAENGNRLLHSQKDRHEHELVREAIFQRLNYLGVDAQSTNRPKLLKLQNIQHLNTEISGKAGPDLSFWDLLHALHPTPAVGGSPREIALERLSQYEDLNRSLYAGAVGFLDKSGDGKAFVAIRSAAVSGTFLQIFAGAGIVEGSDPEKEWSETNLKMNAMRSVFQP